MPTLEGTLIRIACNQSSRVPAVDQLTELPPRFWAGAAAVVDCAIFRDDASSTTLVDDVSNVTSARLVIRKNNKFGDILLNKTTDTIGATTYSAWLGGTDSHFAFDIDEPELNYAVPSSGVQALYFVISVTTGTNTYVVAYGPAELASTGLSLAPSSVPSNMTSVYMNAAKDVQNDKVNYPAGVLWIGGVAFTPTDYSPTGHTHDGRYYTETETDTLLGGKSDLGHNHDSQYFTETETTNLLADKASTAALTSHATDTNNPHSVTKNQVGLGNVTNTADADKPVSTPQATADAAVQSAAAVDATTKADAAQAYAVQRANHTGVSLHPPSAITGTDIDWAVSNVFTKTLGANTTFTFSNSASGETIIVALTNTAGNYTVTWPTVIWAGGVAPTQTVGAKTDIYTFIKIGSTIYGNVVQNF